MPRSIASVSSQDIYDDYTNLVKNIVGSDLDFSFSRSHSSGIASDWWKENLPLSARKRLEDHNRVSSKLYHESALDSIDGEYEITNSQNTNEKQNVSSGLKWEISFGNVHANSNSNSSYEDELAYLVAEKWSFP